MNDGCLLSTMVRIVLNLPSMLHCIWANMENIIGTLVQNKKLVLCSSIIQTERIRILYRIRHGCSVFCYSAQTTTTYKIDHRRRSSVSRKTSL